MKDIRIGVLTTEGKTMTYPNENVFDELSEKVQENYGISQTYYICPDCGDIVIRAEGCGFCPGCGWSPCK